MLVLGSWVGARRSFAIPYLLTASYMVLWVKSPRSATWTTSSRLCWTSCSRPCCARAAHGPSWACTGRAASACAAPGATFGDRDGGRAGAICGQNQKHARLISKHFGCTCARAQCVFAPKVGLRRSILANRGASRVIDRRRSVAAPRALSSRLARTAIPGATRSPASAPPWRAPASR